MSILQLPRITLLGQCAFTYYVLENCINTGIHPCCVAIEDENVDFDPFFNLKVSTFHSWWHEHIFYYYEWKNAIFSLCKMQGIKLIIMKDVIRQLPDNQILIVAGYAKKISVADIKKYGNWAINIHPSLLPDFKGPQPEAQIILHGENNSGVSIHRITDKIDSGNIYYQEKYRIDEGLTVGAMEIIEAKIAVRGLTYLFNNFPNIEILNIDESLISSSYYTWYDSKEILDLKKQDLQNIDTITKLRLRPEGYAYYMTERIIAYPILSRLPANTNNISQLFVDAIIIQNRYNADMSLILKNCNKYLEDLLL